MSLFVDSQSSSSKKATFLSPKIRCHIFIKNPMPSADYTSHKVKNFWEPCLPSARHRPSPRLPSRRPPSRRGLPRPPRPPPAPAKGTCEIKGTGLCLQVEAGLNLPKHEPKAAVLQPRSTAFSPSDLDASKWPDTWRKKVLRCNPTSEADIWPDINSRCVMCGGAPSSQCQRSFAATCNILTPPPYAQSAREF